MPPVPERGNFETASPALGDITDTASLQAALDAAEAAHGQARIVMNIAGIGTAKRRHRSRDGNPASLEDFERGAHQPHRYLLASSASRPRIAVGTAGRRRCGNYPRHSPRWL